MNIMFASTDYVEPAKSSTGLPNYLRRISAALVQRGNGVVIVYGALYNQHRFEGDVEIYAVRVPKDLYRGRNDAESIRNKSYLEGYFINERIESILNDHDIDIIQFTSLEGIALFYRQKVPAVIRLSSYARLAFKSSYNTLPQACIDEYARLEVEAGRHIGHVFGPSIQTAEAYEADYGNKVEIIESPFSDIPELDDSVYKRELLGRKYVLFYGKMYAEKGILEICDILEAFLRQNPTYTFVFVGGDANLSDTSAYALISEKSGDCQDRVLVMSELPHSQLFPIVKNAKCVVLPSYMENFSNACMEAMHYNGCVVATKDAGFEQLIDDEKSGFLCNKGDSKDLLFTINKVIETDEKILLKIRDNAKRRIEKNRPENVVADLINYYNKVLSEDKGRVWEADDNHLNEIETLIDKEKLYAYSVREADKRYLNSRTLAEWCKKLLNKQDPVSECLKNNGYETVAVYGLMDLGRLVVDALEKGGHPVGYTIDSNLGMRYKNYDIYSPLDKLPDADLIIVTPIVYYEEIESNLRDRTDAKIISIEELLFDI